MSLFGHCFEKHELIQISLSRKSCFWFHLYLRDGCAGICKQQICFTGVLSTYRLCNKFFFSIIVTSKCAAVNDLHLRSVALRTLFWETRINSSFTFLKILFLVSSVSSWQAVYYNVCVGIPGSLELYCKNKLDELLFYWFVIRKNKIKYQKKEEENR